MLRYCRDNFQLNYNILMNMVDDRMVLTREMLEETHRDFGEAVHIYETATPRTSQFGRARIISLHQGSRCFSMFYLLENYIFIKIIHSAASRRHKFLMEVLILSREAEE